MRNGRVYIDQNIVGYVHEGRLELDKAKGIDWIYSNEHFTEIARSGDTSYLSVFEKLKAQQIEIVLDDKFRITDSATIHPYSSPFEKYERYVETRNHVEVDEGLFTTILSRIFGADNHQELTNLPERFKTQVETLFNEAGILNELDQEALEDIANDLGEVIMKGLSERHSLESMRRPLGTDKGRVGSPKTENPIQEIWAVIRDKVSGVSSDQFFGFDPLDRQGYETWPMYLGIVGCHTALNFVGYGTDKGIATVEQLPNIMSDGHHIAIAAFCDAVMSNDERFCKKAEAIYRYRNHHTQVLRLRARNND
jgi:hypothetical protein